MSLLPDDDGGGGGRGKLTDCEFLFLSCKPLGASGRLELSLFFAQSGKSPVCMSCVSWGFFQVSPPPPRLPTPFCFLTRPVLATSGILLKYFKIKLLL